MCGEEECEGGGIEDGDKTDIKKKNDLRKKMAPFSSQESYTKQDSSKNGKESD